MFEAWFDRDWYTPDELRFIDSLTFSQYRGYKEAVGLRKDWGKIDKSRERRKAKNKAKNNART